MMPSMTHGRTFIVKSEPVVRGIVVSLCNASVAFVSFFIIASGNSDERAILFSHTFFKEG